MPRFYCPLCGRTVSVLPEQALPYRPVRAERLQAYFDQVAEAGSGPDPPPGQIEQGCMERAWSRLSARSDRLRQAFGQLLSSALRTPAQLWLELRRKVGSLGRMLHWLSGTRKISLLGDYACLKPAD